MYLTWCTCVRVSFSGRYELGYSYESVVEHGGGEAALSNLISQPRGVCSVPAVGLM